MKAFIQEHSQNLKLFFKFGFVALVLIIAYIAFLPNYDALPKMASLSDIFNHFIAFFILAIFLDLGFSPSIKILVGSLLLYGLFIECVQYFLPNRAFDLLDVAVDFSGVLVYLTLQKSFIKK